MQLIVPKYVCHNSVVRTSRDSVEFRIGVIADVGSGIVEGDDGGVVGSPVLCFETSDLEMY